MVKYTNIQYGIYFYYTKSRIFSDKDFQFIKALFLLKQSVTLMNLTKPLYLSKSIIITWSL